MFSASLEIFAFVELEAHLVLAKAGLATKASGHAHATEKRPVHCLLGTLGLSLGCVVGGQEVGLYGGVVSLINNVVQIITLRHHIDLSVVKDRNTDKLHAKQTCLSPLTCGWYKQNKTKPTDLKEHVIDEVLLGFGEYLGNCTLEE